MMKQAWYSRNGNDGRTAVFPLTRMIREFRRSGYEVVEVPYKKEEKKEFANAFGGGIFGNIAASMDRCLYIYGKGMNPLEGWTNRKADVYVNRSVAYWPVIKLIENDNSVRQIAERYARIEPYMPALEPAVYEARSPSCGRRTYWFWGRIRPR